MKVANVPVGAKLFDSEGFSTMGTVAHANLAKAHGFDGFVGYLESMTPTRLLAVLTAGLGFIPITYANAYRQGAAPFLAKLQALGIPPGTTVFTDLEGVTADQVAPTHLIAQLNAWAAPLSKAGYVPGLYVGAPQPLTGPELAALAVYRYFSAASLIVDRNETAWPEPNGCGFCMRQVWPEGDYLGVGYPIDCSQAGQDRKGRVPSWVTL